MDYQRIHKLKQITGSSVLSPSKLRMKMKNNNKNNTAQDEKQGGVVITNVCKKKQQVIRRADSASAAVHPTKTVPQIEDNQCNNNNNNTHESDSNTSSSSFEFSNNGDKATLSRSFSRPTSSSSSKWNDAEKWIINRPSTTPLIHRQKSLKQNKFISTRLSETKTTVDSQVGFSFSQSDVGPTVRAVSMRDMGTEMTPMVSQDPSRASTPMGATTPLCTSPTVSIPRTPRKEPLCPTNDWSEEEEVKMKTRREIIALGIQLGKKNIIATLIAEQDEPAQLSKNNASVETLTLFDYRAAAWEQVEKTKHEASFKREEVMIKMWESKQKAKLEAEMRRIEAKVEEMKLQRQTKMLQKIATATHRAETRRAKAEAMKNQQARRTATMAGYIRRKGHIPYTYMCCGWA